MRALTKLIKFPKTSTKRDVPKEVVAEVPLVKEQAVVVNNYQQVYVCRTKVGEPTVAFTKKEDAEKAGEIVSTMHVFTSYETHERAIAILHALSKLTTSDMEVLGIDMDKLINSL